MACVCVVYHYMLFTQSACSFWVMKTCNLCSIFLYLLQLFLFCDLIKVFLPVLVLKRIMCHCGFVMSLVLHLCICQWLGCVPELLVRVSVALLFLPSWLVGWLDVTITSSWSQVEICAIAVVILCSSYCDCVYRPNVLIHQFHTPRWRTAYVEIKCPLPPLPMAIKGSLFLSLK